MEYVISYITPFLIERSFVRGDIDSILCLRETSKTYKAEVKSFLDDFVEGAYRLYRDVCYKKVDRPLRTKFFIYTYRRMHLKEIQMKELSDCLSLL